MEKKTAGVDSSRPRMRDGNGSPFALAKVSESDWEMLRISFCGMCCYVTLVQYLGLCLLVHKTLSRPLFVYIYALYMFLLVVLFCVGKMHLLASIHDKRWILWIDLPLACSFVVVVVFTFLPDMPFWYRVFGVACNLPTIAVFVYDVAQCVRELLCLRKVPVTDHLVQPAGKVVEDRPVEHSKEVILSICEIN